MNKLELTLRGLQEVPNPKYKAGSKRSKEPATILQPMDNPDTSSQALRLGIRGGLDQTSIDSKENDKYREYGLDWRPGRDMDAALAYAQSNWEKARNAVYQTVVSEVGLGTLRGISDLADFVIGGAMRLASGEDNDYSSPVSQKLQEWQEEFKNNYDIYTKPGLDISNGGLLDAGWWFSNLPSVMSSLTLLIPSTGFTKALSWAGKASKLTKGVGNVRRALTGINKVDKVENAAAELGQVAKLSKGEEFAKWANRKSTVDRANQFVEFGINGFTSRVMENYQEANQVYNDMLPQMLNGDESRGIQGINNMSNAEYNAFIDRNKDKLSDVDTNDRNEVAKRLAKLAADETFKIDMINGFFDVYELYGLRNIKRFMNGPMRASVRRAHLNSMKYAGKTKEEIKDILSKRSFLEKTKDKAGDILYGSRTAIGAQLSEGIEEAINYIAQEEGMNYGNALIADAPQSPFDTRLKNYLNNPQLYESAFWGVMGGIIFQGLGSGLARAKHAADVKRNEKKYALNEETQEQRKKVPWAEAFEMPEITARKNNIEARAIGMNFLKSELEQIDKGVNPWEKENGQNKTLNSNEEKEVARDRAYRKYATNLLINSMFCGNWDITRAYLESDEVRDGLVQAGVLSQDEATRRQEEVKQLADQLEDSYDRNMRVVENVMRGNINGVDLDDMPMEYLQIIASDNMRHELDAQQFGRNIAQYEPIIGSEEERLADELKENGIDYKQAIRSYILAQQLGKITADLEAAKKTAQEGRSKAYDARTISGQTAIRELELRKKVLENMISQVYTPLDTKGLEGSQKEAVERANRLNGAATTLVTLRAVAATEAVVPTDEESPVKDNYTMNLNSKRYKNLDAIITKAFNFDSETNPDGWKEHQKALATLNESLGTLSADEFKQVAQLADTFNENIAAVLGENGAAESLKNLSETLLNSYAAVTYNEIARQTELAQIVKKRTDVREAVHRKHNEIASMRGMMLELANNTLKGIAKKYYDQNADINRLLAYGTLDSTARETLKNLLDDADMKEYDDAMRIFALQRKDKRGNTKQAVENSLLPEMIEDALYESSRDEYEDYDENLLQSSEEEDNEETEEETKKKSTTSEKRKSEKKKSDTSKSKAEPKKADTEEKKAKIVDFNYSKGGKKLTTPRGAIYLNDDGTIDHFEQSATTSDADVQVTMKPVEGEEGVYELDFKTDLDNDGIDSTNEVFTNGKLFSINTPIIDGGQVINNPRVVVNDDGTVEQFTPGEIDNPEREGVEVEEGEESSETRVRPDASVSSTGEESDEVDPSTFDDDGATNDEEATDEEEPVREILDPSDVFGTAVRIIKRRAATGEEFTDEDIYNDLVEEYKDKNNEEGLQEALKLVKKRIKQVINKLNANVKEVDDLFNFLEASSLSDVNPAARAKADLDDLFDKIVENFCKRAAFSEHGGRKIISLENLLRYCNELTNDKMMANLLYDKFVNIIKENDYKYKIVENYNLLNGKLDKDNILQNASKSQEERQDELDNPNGRDLDAGFILGNPNLTYAQKEKIYDILDSLKPDDELEIRREEMHGSEKGRTAIYFIKNGVEIASMPTPRITATGYEQITSFWITDIPSANDGTQSKLEQLFVRIMLNPNNEEELKDVVDAIRTAFYTPRKVDGKKGKVTNPEYIKACRNVYDLLEKVVNLNDYLDLSYTEKNKKGEAIGQTLDEKIHKAINHLINVYSGVKTNSEQWLGKAGMTQAEYDEAIMERRKDSIHRWFKRLKDSYSTIVELANNNDTVVKVDTVNQGGAIIVPKEEAKPVNAKGVIGSAHKGKLDLVVASITEAGKIYSTNGSSMTMGAMTPGSTFLSIPHNSGTPALIHAFPQAIGASHLTGPMKEIQKEILNELNRIITAWATDVNVTVDELEDFLTTLCSHRGGNNPLLSGFEIDRLTGDFNGLQITYKDENDKKHYIKFFDSNAYGLASVIRFDNEPAYAFKKDKNLRKKTLDRIGEIANASLKYNLEFDYIKGSRSLRGYAKRGTKGQFIIQIPNGKVHSFKSYKDFVINNGLISVTTKTNNGKTNYYRPKESSNPKDNPRVTYKLANKSETPRRKEASTPEPTIVKSKGEAVKAMIEAHGNEDDIIKRILTSVLSDDRLKILKDSKLFEELLKGNIKFGRLPDNSFGGHIKNTTSVYGVTYQKGDIVMTQNWIDYLNSDDPEEFDEAITHLIHETIHRKLKTLPKEKYDALMKEVGKIFKEFVAANEADGLPANEGVRQYEFKDGKKLEAKRYTNGELNTLGCEEFLIESITRKAVIKRLNEISTSGETINKRSRLGSLKSKSLLQRILTALAKIFNLNINKGSLLAKEYKMFETFGLTGNVNEESKAAAPTSNISFASKEQEDSYNAVAKLEQFSNDNIKFDKNKHQYSIFGVPTQYSVTQYAEKVFGKRTVRGNYDHSTAIGSSYDALWRDYFDGADVLSKDYPNFNEQRKKDLIKDFERFKKYIEDRFGKGCIIKTKEFYLAGTIKNDKNEDVSIAGAIDMMVIAPNGDIHIFDMKAKNHDIDATYKGKPYDDRRDYTAQQNLYRAIIESNPELEGKVKSLNLIWGSTAYPSNNTTDYAVDDNGQVTVQNDDDTVTKLEDFDKFITPRLKPDINESIIPIEITDTVNNTPGKSQSKKLVISDVQTAIPVQTEVQEKPTQKQQVVQKQKKSIGEQSLDEITVDDDEWDDIDESIVTDINSTYTQEMNNIREEAIANGTFMKAPNGQPTNLTERQWLQVRTKAFKEWFGDWQNDPENASKVIDENGEPLVVYHGTNSEFTKFRESRMKNDSLDPGFYGAGIYFSNSTDVTEGYGSIQMPVFLNIKNPKEMSTDDTSMMGQEITANDGVIASYPEDTGVDWKEYVVPNPNQIKSATDNNGDFSTENDDINYSTLTDVSHPIVSLAQVRDNIIPENRETFERLVNTGGIEINC